VAEAERAAQAERVAQAERAVQAERVAQAERAAQAEKAQVERALAARAQAERVQAARAQAEKAQAEKALAARDQAAKVQAERALQNAREQVAALPAPAPAPRRTTSPSFDCAKARSTTEKLICGDEELARMDRDLGRLHQRAKEAAPDRRAFQRNSDAEWQQREDTCRDRECLRNWYAERRQELSAAAAAPRPAVRAEPVVRTAPVERDDAPPRRAQRPEPVEIALPPGTASGDAGTATMGSN
jgi:uncharacterized protein